MKIDNVDGAKVSPNIIAYEWNQSILNWNATMISLYF